MKKKSYAPKVTKYTLKEDGSKQSISQMKITCAFCDKPLTDSQKYEFLRGKSKGTCSRKCGNLKKDYGDFESYIKAYTKICTNCNNEFLADKLSDRCCSEECRNKRLSETSSYWMKKNNPMKSENTRKKVSETLKRIKHKPYIQGGNGRGATKEQLILYNEICKFDDSFSIEYIFKITRETKKRFKTPNHYKLDLGSDIHRLCIEIDGSSHKSYKIKECDKRKDQALIFNGWRVLRLSNEQIRKELKRSVQMVKSMI